MSSLHTRSKLATYWEKMCQLLEEFCKKRIGAEKAHMMFHVPSLDLQNNPENCGEVGKKVSR